MLNQASNNQALRLSQGVQVCQPQASGRGFKSFRAVSNLLWVPTVVAAMQARQSASTQSPNV
jgi:hypothetical protein